MAKSLYAGVNGTAKKAKKIYLGVNEIAKKVKKIYIGDSNNIARLAYSGQRELSRYIRLNDNLPAGATSAAKCGNKAIFNDGYNNKSELIDSSLTSTLISTIDNRRDPAPITSLGSGAIIAGGTYYVDHNSRYENTYTYEYVSESGSRSGSFKLSNAPNYECATTTFLNYAFFAGGKTGMTCSTMSPYAFTISSSFTVESRPNIIGRYLLCGESLSTHALFAGGRQASGAYSSYVEIFDSSFTKTNGTALSSARQDIGSASVADKFVLFAGGYGSSTVYDIVDIYDKSLTKQQNLQLGYTAINLTGVSTKEYAIFSGGAPGANGGASYKTVLFDSSLTRSFASDLYYDSRKPHCGAVTGNYIIIGSGTYTVYELK